LAFLAGGDGGDGLLEPPAGETVNELFEMGAELHAMK
jgi:hypothetical protein